MKLNWNFQGLWGVQNNNKKNFLGGVWIFLELRNVELCVYNFANNI